jgi:hypothetical protein
MTGQMLIIFVFISVLDGEAETQKIILLEEESCASRGSIDNSGMREGSRMARMNK